MSNRCRGPGQDDQDGSGFEESEESEDGGVGLLGFRWVARHFEVSRRLTSLRQLGNRLLDFFLPPSGPSFHFPSHHQSLFFFFFFFFFFLFFFFFFFLFLYFFFNFEFSFVFAFLSFSFFFYIGL
jgi:hypothetical protein